jgi:SulP family sulfate permease
VNIPRWLPGVSAALSYERRFLRPDLIAGLTVGAMLIPQSMAYAELAGMPPASGFHAVLLALVVYAVLGSSRHLGVGPEPGTAILAATGVGALSLGDPSRFASLMVVVAFVVGALCLAGALLRLGFLAELLSKPVLVGYITGVGLTLISSQLGKSTGMSLKADGFFPRVALFGSRLAEVHPLSLVVTLVTLGVLLALRRFAPKLPGALLGVSGATFVSYALALPSHGLRVVGEISASLPHLTVPSLSWADLHAVLPTAVGIALVGYTDNVLTARSVAARLGYRVNATQELLALGAINVASALSGGFAVSSSASRTAVPAALESKTQLVSLVAAAFVVVAILGFGPVLSQMPEPALSAVILSAGVAIIDVEGFRRLWSLSRLEFGIAVLAALSVMVFDVLTGVLLAVAASVLLALGRIAVPSDSILARADKLDGWVDAKEYHLATTPGLLVYRFDAPLFFANANRFRERLANALRVNPGREEWVVLDFEGVGEIDATAIEMLEDLIAEHERAGLVIAIARANPRAIERLERSGLCRERRYPTINSAVKAFNERTLQREPSLD